MAGRLLTNSLWNVSAYLLFTLLAFVSAPFYIRYLGVERYGLFVLLNSILTPLNLLNVGLGQATIKCVADSCARSNREEAGEYVRTTLLFNIVVGVLGALVIVLLAKLIIGPVFKVDSVDYELAQIALKWIAVGWLVAQVSATLSSVPTALQRYNVVSIGTTLLASGSIVVGILVLWAGGDLLALIQVRFAWGIISAMAWAFAASRMLAGIKLWPRYHSQAFLNSWRFGVWQTIATAGGLLGGQADKWLLGLYTSTGAVGIYSIPGVIHQIAYGVTNKLGEVLFPAVSELSGKGRHHLSGRVVLRSSWLLTAFMAAMMGALFVFAHDLLRLYVGDKSADAAWPVLRLLVLTAIFSAPSIGITQYLLGTGNTHWTAITAVVSGLVTLVSALVLIPRFGLGGAAWSNLLAILLTRPIIHFWVWRRHLNTVITGSDLFLNLYGPVLIGSIGTIILAALYDQLRWHPGWLGLAIGLVSCFSFVGVMIFVVDAFLPNGRERRSQAAVVVAWARSAVLTQLKQKAG